MGTYIPNTTSEQKEMLKEIGYHNFGNLFAQIPEEVKVKGGLNLELGLSELEVVRKMETISKKNKVFPSIFRGAGAYNHFIPSVVTSTISKEEFLTSYTPYQAEISQGILQSVFEYQTMICELTGMEAANASVYDGASAAAEACAMCKERKRDVIYVSQTAHPDTISTIQTYSFGSNTKVVIIPEKEGVTDKEMLKEALGDDSACFYMQQPNYFGVLEEVEALCDIVHEAGAKIIMGCNPILLATHKTPGEYRADIAVGEGQPLGMSLSFGGPYLGFMATTGKLIRKLPGRIVGETVDVDEKRAFVLTLQAREQHIRREKASSNICTNQALCALTAAVYMSTMGPEGMKEVATQSISKAHYLQKELEKIGHQLLYKKPFFHEFVTRSTKETNILLRALEEKGILGGLPLNETDILWCATEMNSKIDMDSLIAIVKEVE